MATGQDEGADLHLIDRTEALLSTEQVCQLQQWLEPSPLTNNIGELDRHLSVRTAQTGSWIHSHPRWTEWNSSSKGILWLHGGPGVGKSVLTACAIDHFRFAPAPVVYVFFRGTSLQSQSMEQLIRSWLSQLVPHSLSLQGILRPLVERGSLVDDTSAHDLCQAFIAGLRSKDRVYLVVDALDEIPSEQAASVLQLLHQASSLDNVKILIASRPATRSLMEKYIDDFISLDLEDERLQSQEEVRLFIKEQLQQSNMEFSARESLCEAILAHCKGNFLTARIALDQLILGNEWVGVYKDQASPSDHLYTAVLREQAARLGVGNGVQVRLLGFVACCYRPVRLRELAGLLVAASLVHSIPAAEKVVQEACFPLLQIGRDEIVRILHQSVLEYLIDSERAANPDGFPMMKEAEVHESMASICLSTLLQAGPNPEHEKLIIQVAHIQYAQAAWSFHLSKIRHQAPLNPEIATTLESICQAQISFPGAGSLPTLLHVAAYVGLTSLAERLITNGDPWLTNLKPERNIFNGQVKVPWGTTPLSTAVHAGHLTIVKMLWTDDMLLRLEDYSHELVLSACTSPDGQEVVRFLMDKGCTPPSGEERFGSYQNFLLRFQYPPQVLPLLVPHIDEQLLSHFITTCAMLARNNPLRAVLNVPRSSALAPWKHQWTGTPLFQVCGARDKNFFHVESVNLLLESVPDVNEKERPRRMYTDQYHSYRPLPTSGGTAVHALTSSWSDENHDTSVAVFALLMKYGADLEVRDDDQQTPLSMLFWKGNVRSVYKPLRTLIDAGVNIDVLDKEGNDLLMRVVKTTRDVGAMRRAMYADRHRMHGPPKWDRDYLRQRPYLGCLWNNTNGPDGQKEVVDYLLTLGCTIEDGGEAVKTTLAIVRHGSVALLEKVLQTRSSDGILSDVLHGFWNAAMKRSEEIQDALLQLLIRAGADINHKDSQGRTMLMFAVTSLRAIDLLLQQGADVDARDNLGRTMVHHLVTPSSWPEEYRMHLQNGSYPSFDDLLARLISLGFEVSSRDEEGKTALHYAVSLFTDPIYHMYDKPLPLDPLRHPVTLLMQEITQHSRLTTKLISSIVARFFDLAARPSRRPLQHAKDLLAAVLTVLSSTGVHMDLNVVDKPELSPLMMASMNLDSVGLPCLLVLSEHGAMKDTVTEEGKNALHLACQARNPTTLGFFIDACPELIHGRDHQGRTPLFDACRSGNAESVLLLLETGGEVTVSDNNGCTLRQACEEFEVDQAEWQKSPLCLARHEPSDDFDQAGHSYSTSLWWLSDQGRTEWREKRQGQTLEDPSVAIRAVTRLLRDHDPAGVLGISDEEDVNRDYELDQLIRQKPLIQPDRFLGQSKSAKDFRWVLKQHIDLFKEYQPEIPERRMSSMDKELQGGEAWASRLLKVAIQTGNTEAVRGLLSPAEATSTTMVSYIQGVSGQQLLRMAAQSSSSNVAMLRFFLQHCHIDINPPSRSSKEVTHLARNDTVGFIDHISPSAVHILCLAEHHWNVLALRYLITHGQPDLTLLSYDGDTLLHIACQSSTPWAASIVKLLLSSGADPSVRNGSGHLCTRNVPLPEVESVLAEFSAPVDEIATQELALAIGKLNVSKVKKAIERGANVRDRIEDPVWSETEYDPGYSGAVVGNGWAAVPLLAALQLVTYDQEERTGARADILRILLEAGASFAEDTDVYDLAVYDEHIARREQPPKDYWAECSDEDAFVETMPFLHAVFKYIRCDKKYLDMLFWDYEDKLRELMEIKGGQAGETLLLAMCNACRDINAGEEEEEKSREENDGRVSSSLGYFLPLLDLGVDISATDNHGNTALHILLRNPSMEEKLICQFINHPSTSPLHHQSDSNGWSPFQLAAKLLRPEAVLALIHLHPELRQTHDQDPDGFTVLHRIAQQATWAGTCADRSNDKTTQHPTTHIESCLQLWNMFLTQGADIDALDGTAEGNPPLFYYITQLSVNNTGTSSHTAHFGSFFTKNGYPQDKNGGNGVQSANFRIRNRKGDTLLHAIVKAGAEHWGGRASEAAALLQMVKEKCYFDPSERDADGRSVAEMIGASRSQRLKDVLKDSSCDTDVTS